MRMTSVAMVAIIAFSGLASAQTITVNGDTIGGPLWNRPNSTTSFGNACNTCPFDPVEITITDPLNFRAETVAGSTFDTFLLLYQGSFDPMNPLANLVALDDDDGGPGFLSMINTLPGTGDDLIGLRFDGFVNPAVDGPLVAGPHVVVVSGFDGVGLYVLELDGAILGFGPLTAGLANDLALQASNLGFLITGAQYGPVPNVVKSSLQARAAAESRQALGLDVAGFGTTVRDTGVGRMAGDIHVWTDAGYRRGDSNVQVTSELLHFQIGGDYAIDPDMVLGLAMGIGDFESKTGGSAVDGLSVWVQPYTGFDFGLMRGSLAASIGFVDYDNYTAGAATASARSTTFSANAFLAHDIELGAGMTLSPYADATISSERISDFKGALAGSPDVTVRSYEVAGGLEFTQTFNTMLNDGEFVGAVFFRAEAQYRNTNAPGTSFTTANLDRSSVSAGFAAGMQVEIDDDITGQLVLSADGVGSDVVEYGGRARVDLKF